MSVPSLSVTELRSAVARLLDAVEDRFGTRITFPEDYYWNVPLNQAVQLDREPKLDVGSVVDDVDSICAFFAADPDRFTSISHDADHIAGALRAIARLGLSHSR